MPDELQELARVAAASVVRAIGSESWPTVRASTLNLLSRHGDPGAATWVDTFGSMISGADGREQNGLRDAAYARFESVFGNLLATRPEAAAELALLVIPGSPGQGGASAPAAGSPLNFAKEPSSSGPPGHSAPGSSGPPSPQSFPPPAGFPGPPAAAPPPPPGPPPGSAPYAAQHGAPYQGAPQQPGQSGPYQGGPYQGGAPHQMPGAPMPGGHMPPGNGSSNNKALIWGLVAVVAVGAIVGGVVLLGGSDDDNCSSASGSAAKPMSGSLTVAAESDCAGSAGGVPGPNGGSGKGGGDDKNGSNLDGSWSGKYQNETPAKLSGSFTVSLQRDGDKVTGELSLDVADCDLSGPVSGRVNGDKLQISSTGSADSIKMTGTISGDSMSGVYSTTCNDAAGSWTADK